MANIFEDFISMGQGLASGGGVSSGPLGAAGAQAGVGGAIGLAGLGLSIAGGMQQTSAAKEGYQAQMNIANLEMKVNEQRRQAMELDARRREMETFRNAQRARALALTNATSQGAQQGSGLQGGYGQISGQSGVNFLGIEQNLQIGQNIFGLDNQISQQKINYAQAQSKAASASGMSNLGSSLVKAAPMLAMALI